MITGYYFCSNRRLENTITTMIIDFQVGDDTSRTNPRIPISILTFSFMVFLLKYKLYASVLILVFSGIQLKEKVTFVKNKSHCMDDGIQIINALGLASGFIGALVVFSFSPKVSSSTFLYNQSEESRILRTDRRKNRISKMGMILIAIGFGLQLVALWI